MKKALFLVASLFVASLANAQEEISAEVAAEQSPVSVNLKPDEGSFTLEVAFCPFQSESVSLENGRITGIYALTDEWSIRAGLGFGNSSSEEDGNETTTTSFSFAPGAFYSFEGTDRITPYLGGELIFRKATEEVENNGNKRTSYDIFGFGIQAFTGMNYYFTQNAYVGVEFGVGFNTQKEDESGDSSTSFAVYAQPAVRLGWAF